MTNRMTTSALAHLASLSAAALLGTACGSSSTASPADTTAATAEPAVATPPAAVGTTVPSASPIPTTPAPAPAPTAATAPPTDAPPDAPSSTKPGEPTPTDPDPVTPSIDDLVATPIDPVPRGDLSSVDELRIGAPACAVAGPVPAGASVVSDVLLDLMGDGTADDHVVTYLDSGWTIRSTVDGITSEVAVAGVGPGSVRAIGAANVAGLSAGDELIATVGAGASSTQIGVYGFDTNGCIFAFLDGAGSVLTVNSGASIGGGSRFSCGSDFIAQDEWERQGDGTYEISGAAYIESSPGQFTYLPASDSYAEGLTFNQLPASVFDCNGLTF